MFEMAASAAASFAARSLVAIVSGAVSWRNEAFGVPPSSINSADIRPDLRFDPRRIPHEAVEHRAGGAQVVSPGRHQFAPQRIAKRAAGGDVNLVRAKVVERLQHQSERVATNWAARDAGDLVEDVRLEDRHCAADNFHVRPEGAPPPAAGIAAGVPSCRARHQRPP